MAWVIGISGFLGGFAIGIALVRYWLKDIAREELINDKTLHWRYGTFVWFLGVIFAVLCITAYKIISE